MDYLAIIVSIIALAGAGFAFLRASSSHRILIKRTEKLKEQISYLEAKLKGGEVQPGKGRRGAEDSADSGRRQQERHEQNEARHEERQRQREKRNKPERQPQDRQMQEEGVQERQQDKRQRERQPRERPQQEKQAEDRQTPQSEEGQQQRRPKRENRRRNEPRDASSQPEPEEVLIVSSTPISLDTAGAGLLDELEQGAAHAPTADSSSAVLQEPELPAKYFAIIPEDGVIRQHQLQQQPDSDSYIEVDNPTQGGNRTHYRFNLSGNHAFVISQGIDRLENAFSFEKPSNRMVSRVVQQRDGVLSRVGNGWKIEEKARIDFK